MDRFQIFIKKKKEIEIHTLACSSLAYKGSSEELSIESTIGLDFSPVVLWRAWNGLEVVGSGVVVVIRWGYWEFSWDGRELLVSFADSPLFLAWSLDSSFLSSYGW